MSQPHVTAVILAHNNRATLLRVIGAVLQQHMAPKRVIVVDNAGTDGGAEAVAARFPTVTVIRLDENRGVGAGHNAGWRMALDDPDCEFVWALEHDSVPLPGCLAELLRAQEALPADTIVAPCIVHPPQHVANGANGAVAPGFAPDRDGDSTSGSSSPSYSTWQWEHLFLFGRNVPAPHLPPQPASVFTFNGTLLPAQLMHTVGRLNENLFFYWEDWDYTQRCLATGAAIYRVPAARLIHDKTRVVRQFTFGKRRLVTPLSISPFRIYYIYRNHIFIKKHKMRGRVRWLLWLVASYCLLQTVDLVTGPGRHRRWWARTLALRDGVLERMGRADYPVLQG